MLGAIFARIFRVLVKVFRDFDRILKDFKEFARIFTTSKFWVCAWIPASYTNATNGSQQVEDFC